MNPLHDTATDEEIVHFCSRSNPDRQVVSELDGGKSIVKISNLAVVKCGFGVTEDEARNQRQAYKLIHPTIIRIPRVYRYFESGAVGYIVMEYIEGETLDSVMNPDLYVDQIGHALSQFSQISHDTPGPLGGGLARGRLWLDCDYIAPASVDDIERYYNTRQLKSRNLNIKRYPLALCHLDIAPRNIIRSKDGSLYLLDWASAGFYPRLFELCVLRLNGQGQGDWNDKVIKSMEDINNEEKIQADLLEHAYYLGQRYFYGPRPCKPVLPPGFIARKARRQKEDVTAQ